MRSFFDELRRRNVYRSAVFYAAAGWLLVQIATQVFPVFDLPNWMMRLVVVAVIVGFPFGMLFAWYYEWTSRGLQRESDVASDESIKRATRKKLDRWIVAVLSLAIVLLLADKFVLRKDTGKPASDSDKSIAVLPFENLSEDKANAYFASGIEDEILTRLSKIGALKVISRTSTQQYASKPGNLPEIARQLGVANILQGSVQKAGDSVRVNVQLIQAAGDSHLWAETYDRKLENIFGVESEVATAIADSLQAKLTGSEQRALAVQPTDNVAAYDAYLRGLAVEAGSNRLDDWRRATAAYAAAVQLDPRFALAWAHLASARSGMYFNGVDIAENTPDTIKQAADTALRLQPELGEAWLAQGSYRYRVLHDFPGALQTFYEARKRLPNSALLSEAIAFVEKRMGRWEEALAAVQEAVRLDPRKLGLLYRQVDEFLLPMRRFAEAHAALDRAIVIAPNDTQFIAAKAKIYLVEGRVAEAARLLDPLPLDPKDDVVFPIKLNLLWTQRRFDAVIAALQPTLPIPGEPLTAEQTLIGLELGYAQLRVGQTSVASSLFERVIRTLKPTSDATVRHDGGGLPMTLALAYAGLGDRQAALDQAREAIAFYRDDAPDEAWAEITLAQIQSWLGDNDAAIAALPHLLQMPAGLNPADLHDFVWDPLREDPRFQKLLADALAAAKESTQP